MSAVEKQDRTISVDAKTTPACRVVTNLEGFVALESTWDKLLDASEHSTPWQSFDYLLNWWRNLSNRMPLRIFVVERNGQPCLIAPLQVSKWWGTGFPVKMLEPIAMLMDVNRPRLALGPMDTAAYTCLMSAIWERRREWDVLCIDEKPWDDRELHLLREFAISKDCIFRNGFSHLVPYLNLDQSWQAFLATKSQKFRKNLKTARRKLEETGEVSLREFQSESEIEAGLDIVVELHRRSWKRRGRIEHSESAAYQRFYRAWMISLAKRGSTRILVMCCGERPVAATIAIIDGSTYYSAQIVHDVEYAHCSPGTLLESLELEQLMNSQRYVKYDFLGSFLNNKMRWTDTAMPTSHVFLLRKTFRNFLLDGYYFLLKPYVRPAIIRFINKLRNKHPRKAVRA